MALAYLDPQTWTPSTHLDVASWEEAVVPKVASDSLVLAVTEAVAVTQVKSATDTALLVVTDVGQSPVISGVTLVAATDALTLVVTDSSAIVSPTLKTATDLLTLIIQSENRAIAGQTVTPIVASDSLQLILTEAPIAARLTSTDDVLTPILGDVGVSPFASKTASDTLLLTLSAENWTVVTGEGETLVSASDALLLSAVDTVDSLQQVVVIVASDTLLLVVNDVAQLPAFDDTRFATDGLTLAITEVSAVEVVVDSKAATDDLVLALTETSAIELPVPKTASDTLVIICGDTHRLAFFEAPPVGALPPGWLEQEVTELAGIARPWRINPNNVTPIQGWMPRKYWAVYDERGNLVATDRWQNVARAKAWTHYHSGRWAA